MGAEADKGPQSRRLAGIRRKGRPLCAVSPCNASFARWARWAGAIVPVGGLGAEDEVHGAALGENVVPGHPRLVPGLAVDLEALYVVRVFLAKDLKVALLVPFEPLVVGLPDVRGHALDSMLCNGLLHNGLQQVHGDAVRAVR